MRAAERAATVKAMQGWVTEYGRLPSRREWDVAAAGRPLDANDRPPVHRQGMLFFVFGSLASGKSRLLRALRGKVSDIALVDADLPRPAKSKADRQRRLQQCLEEIRSEGGPIDVLYAGQSPLGELLACPVATEFAGIAPCLLDCGDAIRIQRVRSRGWRNDTSESDLLRWSAWMRLHAVNPQHDQSVLIAGGAAELRWERWNRWQRSDARWQVTVIDNSYDEQAETTQRLLAWIVSRRRLLTAGRLPLAAGWDRARS